MKDFVFVLAASTLGFVGAPRSQGASATARATQVILAAFVANTIVGDVDLENVEPGAESESLEPTKDCARCARLKLRGEEGRSFTVTYPRDGVRLKRRGPASVASSIQFHDIKIGGNSSGMSASGESLLIIGGTRSALPLSQNPGAYSGELVLTVIY
jgi:hypothetical protein